GNKFLYSAYALTGSQFNDTDCNDNQEPDKISSGGSTTTNPGNIKLVFGGQGSTSIAGALYTVGTDNHGTQLLYLAANSKTFSAIDDSNNTTTQCMPSPNKDTGAQNLNVAADYAFVAAYQETDSATPTCVNSGTNRKFYYHSPQNTSSKAVANVSVNPTNPSS